LDKVKGSKSKRLNDQNNVIFLKIKQLPLPKNDIVLKRTIETFINNKQFNKRKSFLIRSLVPKIEKMNIFSIFGKKSTIKKANQ
jgi:hypothetical protein